MALIPHMSRGRVLLLAVLQRTTACDVAARCCVSSQVISDWASGRRQPCLQSRNALASQYGIPASTWDYSFQRLRDTQSRPRMQ